MALEVDINVRNMEVTDRINEYVTKKASKLDRYLSGIEETHVELSFVKSARSAADRQVAEITVRGKGFVLRAEERSDDIFAAFDTAIDKMQRRMERYKGKHHRGRVNERSKAEVKQLVAEEESEEEQRPVIVRRKRFILDPMDEMDAIERMGLLGHESFFLFYNVDTKSVNVLYRRRDGSYGLIEPEVR